MAAVCAQRAAGVAALALRRALAAPAPVVVATASVQGRVTHVGNRVARLQLHSTSAAAVPVTPPVDMKEKHHTVHTLPAAVVLWLADLPPDHPAVALLAGHVAATTSIYLSEDQDITDDDIARLPPTVRKLDVSGCFRLTQYVSFAHLTALESLDCGYTDALDAGLTRLPPSLRQLAMSECGLPATADFNHLPALRVLRLKAASQAMLDILPPCLEELEMVSWPPGASLAHLTQLRVLHVVLSDMDNASLAMLPPSLVELKMSNCLHGDKPSALTAAAVFSHLPALRVLDVSCTGIGDASIASMPAGLEVLRMVHCRGVTQRASLDHLTALRNLDCAGTDLPRVKLAA